jgi:molybdopterin converting factor small subunit
MNIHVHYLSVLRQASGVATETLEVVEGATVGDVLCFVRDIHGASMTQLLHGNDGYSPVCCIRQGKCLPTETVLEDQDEITLMLPLSEG